MSHPNPSHDSSNEYPEDKVTHYPRAKALKKRTHKVTRHLDVKPGKKSSIRFGLDSGFK